MQQALDVVQNNVTNSSTPGYAAQQLNFEAAAVRYGKRAGRGRGLAVV